MHNAGNDAYFTLASLRVMAEGGPLDIQRKARWPDRTEGLKVLPRDESEDELDDDEFPNMSAVVSGPTPSAPAGEAPMDTAA